MTTTNRLALIERLREKKQEVGPNSKEGELVNEILHKVSLLGLDYDELDPISKDYIRDELYS